MVILVLEKLFVPELEAIWEFVYLPILVIEAELVVKPLLQLEPFQIIDVFILLTSIKNCESDKI